MNIRHQYSQSLNLANQEHSSIRYKVSKFPDGQQSITLLEENLSFWQIATHNNVEIKSRLNSFRDLELIICATQALKGIGVENIFLNIPYCIGGRSDRKFEEGGINYIKTVIAPIINSQGYRSVTVLDPHSDVLEACINNFEKQNNFKLVRFALEDIDNKDGASDRICLVSPDAGAYKKIFDVAQYFDINNIITASKVRDVKTGKIIHTEVPGIHQHENYKYVIVDDICDGGRTFVEIAKAFKSVKPDADLYLVVTHGIFSAGFEDLDKYFTHIYCTDSVYSLKDATVANDLYKDFVKQFPLF